MIRPLAICVLVAATAAAQSFSYPNFQTTPQLALLGNAVATGGALRLTANSSNQSGWCWRQTPMPVLAGFDTTFTFRITPPQFGTKAEGMAFVIHDDPNGANAVGGTVWGMGYGYGANSSAGIRRSIAVEIDTYQDPFLGDSSANELTVHTRGSVGNHEHEQYSLGRTTPNVNFADGQPHTLRVVYVPGTLEVFVDNAAVPALSLAYDLQSGGVYANNNAVGGIGASSGTAFAGFCATTGAGSLTEQVEILSWDWTSTPLVDPCYAGTLGADTLTIDGSAGDAFRRVEVATHQPFAIELADPPAFGAGAPFVLYASLLAQPGAVGTGLGFGQACFPMLPPGPFELVVADSFGLFTGLFPTGPTPATFAVPVGAIPFPVELTFQAVTLASSSPLALGLSNAVELGVVAVPAPQITSIAPLSATAGTAVTIAGNGFVPGLSLTVAGQPVPATWNSSGSVSFAYPNGLGCDAPIVLTNPDGQTASATLNPTPTVTGTVLGSGPAAGGSLFIIQGNGFAPGTTVTIGGAAATPVSASAFVVTVYTPPGTPGTVPVVVTTPGGCSATTSYTYQ